MWSILQSKYSRCAVDMTVNRQSWAVEKASIGIRYWYRYTNATYIHIFTNSLQLTLSPQIREIIGTGGIKGCEPFTNRATVCTCGYKLSQSSNSVWMALMLFDAAATAASAVEIIVAVVGG